MHKCFHFLIVWVLKKHAFLQGVDSCVEQHIRHEYYKEMSEVGPTKTNVGSVKIPGLQEPVKVINGQFHPIVFGGDQMAAVCPRGAQHIRSNSTEQKMVWRVLYQSQKTGTPKCALEVSVLTLVIL